MLFEITFFSVSISNKSTFPSIILAIFLAEKSLTSQKKLDVSFLEIQLKEKVLTST